MNNETLIQLYDNEQGKYPLIKITQGFEAKFHKQLKKIQSNPNHYYWDKFLKSLQKFKWFNGIVECEEVYF